MPSPDPAKKWITLPTEIAARELDAKLLLGCAAVGRGYNVIVGSIRAVTGALPALPRGVWVTGCVDRSKAPDLHMLREKGYRIVCCDEEGFFQFNDSHYARNRLSREGLSEIDCMMAASPDHVRIITNAYPEVRDKVVETGNPRVDLLRPEFRSIFARRGEALRRRFGKFVLVNGNFSENALVGQEMLRHMRTISGGIVDEHDDAWYAARHEYETAMLEEFRKMLSHLGRETPDVPIVFRPHPQEDFGRWREMLGDYPNITVLYEDTVYSWAMAAALVVHNNCTTGIESHLLGRPVVTYRPIRSDEYDYWLPNAVSDEITDLDSLQRRVRAAVTNGHTLNDGFEYRHRDVLERHFGPLEGPLAYQRMLDVIDRVPVEPQRFPSVGFPSPLHTENLRETVRLAAQKMPRLASRVFGEAHLRYWLFDQQKFPSLPLSEASKRVAELQRANPDVGNVDIREIAHDLFVISKPDPAP